MPTTNRVVFTSPALDLTYSLWSSVRTSLIESGLIHGTSKNIFLTSPGGGGELFEVFIYFFLLNIFFSFISHVIRYTQIKGGHSVIKVLTVKIDELHTVLAQHIGNSLNP